MKIGKITLLRTYQRLLKKDVLNVLMYREHSGEKSYGISAITCDYIGVTGHCRGCKPDECKHYLDDPAEVKEIRAECKRHAHAHAHVCANEVNVTRKKEQIKW